MTISTNHADRAHAILAPSSMKMRFNCLASLLEPPGGVVLKESEFASEGTAAHELMESMLKAQSPFVDQGKVSYPKLADAEMVAHIEQLAALVSRIRASIGEKNIVKELIEERVYFSDHIYGTLDYGLLYIKDGEKRLYILDLKYGRGLPVLAHQNEQLMTYALAVMETHKWQAKQATISIFQPRNIEEVAQPLDQWVADERTLKEFKKNLKSLEKKALKVINKAANPKEVPGEHCRFCQRKVVCRSYARHSSAPGLIALDSAAPLEALAPEDKELPSPEELTEEQLSTLCLYADKITKFLKDCQTYVAARVAATGFPGWKLVEGRSQRKWVDDDEEAIAFALQQLGVDDPWQKKLRGITEIEKQIGKGKLDDLTVKPAGTPKLVPDTDPRPAIKEAASDLLDELVLE